MQCNAGSILELLGKSARVELIIAKERVDRMTGRFDAYDMIIVQTLYVDWLYFGETCLIKELVEFIGDHWPAQTRTLIT